MNKINKNKKYKLASEQNKYTSGRGSFKKINEFFIPVVLSGIVVFTSSILVAYCYKSLKDDELYNKLHSSNSSYVNLNDGYKFKYGYSNYMVKINKYLNSTSIGYYIRKHCDKHGIDVNVIISMLNCDGLLNDNLTEEIIEHKIDTFCYNLNVSYDMLSYRYPDISSQVIKGISILCAIQSSNIGIDTMTKLIYNYKLFDGSNKFDYSKFKQAIGLYSKERNVNYNNNYIDDVFSNISYPDLYFNINGESVDFSLSNDINHLCSDGYIIM